MYVNFDNPENRMPNLDQIAHAGVYKVSRVGQVSIAAPVIRRWGMEQGGGVLVNDLETMVMLYPEADSTIYNTDRASSLRKYAVSSVGQMTLPADIRKRWGVCHGGRVEFIDLKGPVLYLAQGALRQLHEELFPSEALAEVAKEMHQSSN